MKRAKLAVLPSRRGRLVGYWVRVGRAWRKVQVCVTEVGSYESVRFVEAAGFPGPLDRLVQGVIDQVAAETLIGQSIPELIAAERYAAQMAAREGA